MMSRTGRASVSREGWIPRLASQRVRMVLPYGDNGVDGDGGDRDGGRGGEDVEEETRPLPLSPNHHT